MSDIRILLAGSHASGVEHIGSEIRTRLGPTSAIRLVVGERAISDAMVENGDSRSGAADVRVFVDMDERLHILRWLETAEPGLGAVEALVVYNEQIEPYWIGEIRKQITHADLVVDGEKDPSDNAERILFFTGRRHRHAVKRQAPTVVPAPAQQVRTAVDSEALMRRYGGPLIGLRYRMRRLLLRLRADRDNVLESVYGMSKRGIDVLLTSLVLFGIWPFLMITAFLIWVSDPGPVFYYQTRVGKDGRTFRFPKFRSMVINAERLKDKLASQSPSGNDVRFKMKRDPRIIPIGYVLRRYSIDELPQLWSVLRGDLSLVGPRPPLPREVDLYTMADRRRLEVVPGLTCIWQVTGRSDIPFEEQVKLDTDYIDGRGLALDLKLLIATLGAVVTARGAY